MKNRVSKNGKMGPVGLDPPARPPRHARALHKHQRGQGNGCDVEVFGWKSAALPKSIAPLLMKSTFAILTTGAAAANYPVSSWTSLAEGVKTQPSGATFVLDADFDSSNANASSYDKQIVIEADHEFTLVGNAAVLRAGNGGTTSGRFFELMEGSTLNVENLTLTGGAVNGLGGAILVNARANLHATDLTFANNSACAGSAVAALSGSVFTCDSCVAIGNLGSTTAGDDCEETELLWTTSGGAVLGYGATAILTSSQLISNTHNQYGSFAISALALWDGAHADLNGCNVSNNTIQYGDGATIAVTNASISMGGG